MGGKADRKLWLLLLAGQELSIEVGRNELRYLRSTP